MFKKSEITNRQITSQINKCIDQIYCSFLFKIFSNADRQTCRIEDHTAHIARIKDRTIYKLNALMLYSFETSK